VLPHGEKPPEGDRAMGHFLCGGGSASPADVACCLWHEDCSGGGSFCSTDGDGGKTGEPQLDAPVEVSWNGVDPSETPRSSSL